MIVHSMHMEYMYFAHWILKKKKKFFGVFFSKNNFRVAKDKMCDKHDVAEIWLIHNIVFYRYCTHPFSFDIK